MNLKIPAAIVITFLIILVAVSLFISNSERPNQIKLAEPKTNFSISITNIGLADNDFGKSVRAYVTADLKTEGNPNTTIDLITLSKAPLNQVYYVTDYPGNFVPCLSGSCAPENQQSSDKTNTVQVVMQSLLEYGITISPITLDAAMKKNNSVILIPVDALPAPLAGSNLTQLINSNAVIFFGKSLTIAEDISGSEVQIGNSALNTLNLTLDQVNGLSPVSNEPVRLAVRNATVFEYPSGWFVVYPQDTNPNPGFEIADLIKKQSWQSQNSETDFSLINSKNKTTEIFFSNPLQRGNYFLRLIFDSQENNFSSAGITDIGFFNKSNNTLSIDSVASSFGVLNYIYELWDNLTYPKTYSFGLRFIKDNASEITQTPIGTATMKTYATDSGQVSINLTQGNYLVELVDQNDVIHAIAYTHVPNLQVKLIRIEGVLNVFNVTMDDLPLSGQKVALVADGQKTYSVQTDGNGQVRIPFILGSGRHSFTLYVNGWNATTYYIAPEDQSKLMLIIVFAFGILFIGIILYFGSLKQKKFSIKVNYRQPVATKTLRIPYSYFNKLFQMIQTERASGLPLSIADLRIGIRKHLTFKGGQLFVTDSNLYRIIDKLTKTGTAQSYNGFFLLQEMAENLPIEYWVMKRKIFDSLMENGEKVDLCSKKPIKVNGKTVHLWPELNSLSIAGKPNNLLIFPDEERKTDYLISTQKHTPILMQLTLEIQYGQIKCLTIEEYLGRSS